MNFKLKYCSVVANYAEGGIIRSNSVDGTITSNTVTTIWP